MGISDTIAKISGAKFASGSTGGGGAGGGAGGSGKGGVSTRDRFLRTPSALPGQPDTDAAATAQPQTFADLLANNPPPTFSDLLSETPQASRAITPSGMSEDATQPPPQPDWTTPPPEMQTLPNANPGFLRAPPAPPPNPYGLPPRGTRNFTFPEWLKLFPSKDREWLGTDTRRPDDEYLPPQEYPDPNARFAPIPASAASQPWMQVLYGI